MYHFIAFATLLYALGYSIGTQEQLSKALTHIERIIKAKASTLNKESKNRRIPMSVCIWKDCLIAIMTDTASKFDFDIDFNIFSGFKTKAVTLHHVINWLVRQCGRPQTACRHQCMQLVYGLAPHLTGILHSLISVVIYYSAICV